MPLTQPNDFPVSGGVDKRDENHPFIPRKPSLRVFLKPLSQKVVDKNLWVEVTTILLVSTVCLSALFGQEIPNTISFALGVCLALVLVKFVNIENETHLSKIQFRDKPIENPEKTIG